MLNFADKPHLVRVKGFIKKNPIFSEAFYQIEVVLSFILMFLSMCNTQKVIRSMPYKVPC